MKEKFYEATNENMQAVNTGIRRENPHQTIISICSAADIPIWLTTLAEKVIAVDNNQAQIDFAKKRTEELKNGRFKKFLSARGNTFLDRIALRFSLLTHITQSDLNITFKKVLALDPEIVRLFTASVSSSYIYSFNVSCPSTVLRNYFWLENARMEKARENLHKLFFSKNDITLEIEKNLKSEDITGVYLSNVTSMMNADEITKLLASLNKLPRFCRIYSAEILSGKLPSRLEINETISEEVYKKRNLSFSPTVYDVTD
ncbi:MAG: hypothetical protein PHU71_04100 [Candidatus Gracilibacteria bacterium]|nr:hypothetical protein [Candidatus Gracilibacteria bacterium]